MTIYFDTNVYDFVSNCGETKAVRSLLTERRQIVKASWFNLHEIFANGDAAVRQEQMATLTRLATRYEQVPLSYVHAQEFLAEVRRLRPSALASKPDRDAVKLNAWLVRQHTAEWKRAQRDPSYVPQGYEVYARDAGQATTSAREFTKTLRQQRTKQWASRLGAGFAKSAEAAEAADGTVGFLTDPELYWRVLCQGLWHTALVLRHPGMRDYADWTLPYLKPLRWTYEDYQRFWLHEVAADAVPTNRATSLAEYYQIHRAERVGHGHPTDTLHAGYSLQSDLLLTADRGFCDVMIKVRAHFHRAARVRFLDRSAGKSALEEIKAALKEHVET